MSRTALRYISGEEIKAGDHVIFHGHPATIEFVAADPENPSAAWYVQEYSGGVMVCDPAASGSTFIPADDLAEYEDLEFRSRVDGASARDLGQR